MLPQSPAAKQGSIKNSSPNQLVCFLLVAHRYHLCQQSSVRPCTVCTPFDYQKIDPQSNRTRTAFATFLSSARKLCPHGLTLSQLAKGTIKLSFSLSLSLVFFLHALLLHPYVCAFSALYVCVFLCLNVFFWCVSFFVHIFPLASHSVFLSRARNFAYASTMRNGVNGQFFRQSIISGAKLFSFKLCRGTRKAHYSGDTLSHAQTHTHTRTRTSGKIHMRIHAAGLRLRCMQSRMHPRSYGSRNRCLVSRARQQGFLIQ